MKFIRILFFYCCLNSEAQILDWNYRLGGIRDDFCHDIEIDENRSIYLAGEISDTVNFNLVGGSTTFYSKDPTMREMFFAKYNPDKILDGVFILHGDYYRNSCIDLAIDKNRNIFIGGFYKGTVDFNPSNAEKLLSSEEYNYFVAKYDSLGNFQWVKNLDLKNEDYGLYFAYDNFHSLELYIDSLSNLYINYPNKFCKMDPNGQILWSLNVFGKVVFDNKNFFYSLDSSWSKDKTSWQDNLSLKKIDLNGTVLFNKEILSNDTTKVNGYLTFDKSGHLLVNGYHWGKTKFNGISNSITLKNYETDGPMPKGGPYPRPTVYIAKYDIEGNIIWAYQYGYMSPSIQVIETTQNGSIYFIASSFYQTPNPKGGENIYFGKEGSSLCKHDSSFNYLGNAVIRQKGETYYDRFKIQKDSTAFICGTFNNTINLNLKYSENELLSNGSFDMFFGKYINFDGEDKLSSIKKEEVLLDFEMYPNPFKNHIYFKNHIGQLKSLIVTDFVGKEVFYSETLNEQSIDLSFLENGVYFVIGKYENNIIKYKFLKDSN